jgi:hypothetical protein
MGAPVFFTLGGGSVGWQFGGEQTDFVLLVMDRNGMDNLLRDSFKIGGEAGVAAGPVGRSAEAATDVLLGAAMLSWSRSQGVFAGASLEGSVLKPNNEANERLYGRPMTARQIFESRPAVPEASREFVQLASRLTSSTEQTAQMNPDTTAADMERPAHGYGYEAQGYQQPSYEQPDQPSMARRTDTQYTGAVTGTVVTLSDSRLTIDTADGQRSFTVNSSTERQGSIDEGNRVYVQHDGNLVATRIAPASDELPRTASALPLLALAGLLSLFVAWRMRARTKA